MGPLWQSAVTQEWVGVVSRSEGCGEPCGLSLPSSKGTASRQSSLLGITMTYEFPEKHEPTRRLLADRWPHLFLIPVPLKIGIHRDILAAFDSEGDRPFSVRHLHSCLHHWTQSPDYKATLERSNARYDLAGNLCPKYRPAEYWGAF